MIEKLDDSNFLLFCAKNYDNAHCHDTEEFYEDLRRIKYIKKLITRYIVTGDLKERLILNHIIILQNVFGSQALCKIIFLKMESQLKYIKPFLVMLNIMPERVYNVGKDGKTYITDEIDMDPTIIEALRKI
jgi:hypothetical protein